LKKGTKIYGRSGEGKQFIALRNAGEGVFSLTHSQIVALQEREIVGQEATIWYSGGRTGGRISGRPITMIRKMIVDDEVVMPFRSGVRVNIFFILLITFFMIGLIRAALLDKKEAEPAPAGADLQSVPNRATQRIQK